ncbi:MAG: hypothetical protein ACTS73_09715, partial [Arsenophonus sp. NEOnobi-MAG3]
KRFNNHIESLLRKLHHKNKCFSYLRCMLNSLSLLEVTETKTAIDLKTRFRWCHCFLASATTGNINALSGIEEEIKEKNE